MMDSFQAQTWQHFEIICQDNLSTDDTEKIVKSYEPAFEGRLKFYTEPDRGVYDAMNKAITKSGGEWIYFIGSDDYLYDPSVLKQMAICLKNSDSDVVYGKVFFEYFNKIEGSKDDWCNLAQQNVCHQAIFYRKRLFKSLGLFNQKYSAMADWDFNLRCLHAQVPVEFIESTICFYSAGGISAKGDPAFYRDFTWLNAKYAFEYSSGFKKVRSIIGLIKEQIILWKKQKL